MPYYCYPRDPIAQSNALTVRYDTRTAASNAAKPGETVVYVATDDERTRWRQREALAFSDGTYTRVPWSDLDRYPDHFAHVSVEVADMVAYLPNDESAYTGKKTRIRPGKYLERFYSHVRIETRERWIESLTPFTIARSADDIEAIYRGVECTSCMGPRAQHYPFEYEYPVRVYGDSDLAVAYVGTLGSPIARVTIWPARKIMARAYCQDVAAGRKLTRALEYAGYHVGDFIGAKIRRIICDEGYVVPYCDGGTRARDIGNGYLKIGDGPISLAETRGYTADDGETCAHCEDVCEVNRRGYCESCAYAERSCEHCDRQYFDFDGCMSYCESCEDSRTGYCEHCDSDTWETMYFAESVDEYVCEDCARSSDDSRFDCEYCGERCREWELDRDRQRARIDDGTALRYCEDCAGIVLTCHSCEDTYEKIDGIDVPLTCPHCGISPRCAHTADLLGTLDTMRDRAIA